MTERERIEATFVVRNRRKGDAPLYEDVCEAAKTLAIAIDEACPNGKEKNAAVKLVEEAWLWANHGIERRS